MPAEAELCAAVGLSEDEYWHFLELTERYTGERSEEYAHIPDVRNEPVSIIVNLVIGIALTAIGALLAPKPQQPKTPRSRTTASITGRTRFLASTQFDSVQELATLGDTIPLVFTRQGVRVQGQLLWSQMLSQFTGQQLRALFLFSSGEVQGRPDFSGFAIGDTLLENYIKAKIALYFMPNGGRPREGTTDRYNQGTANNVPNSDAFSVYWDSNERYEPYFSGTRNPSTQAQFGVYSPMPNGMRFKVDYELVLKPQERTKKLGKDIWAKKTKVAAIIPRLSHIKEATSSRIVYRIGGGLYGGSTVINDPAYRLDDGNKNDPHPNTFPGGNFKPWGTDDIKSFVESEKVETDEALSIGDSYMVGNNLCVGFNGSEKPWYKGTPKEFVLKIEEPGNVSGLVRAADDTRPVYSGQAVMRAAVGVVTNNRACDCTEIGLKSTVYKQITGFPNVNSYPGEEVIDRYEADGGSFTLGGMTKYVYRLSFFQIQFRALGSNGEWLGLNKGRLYCVRGRTPQPQYNFIRFSHKHGQYEWRFLPVPGNYAFATERNQTVFLLGRGDLISFEQRGVLVTFRGRELLLSDGVTTNSEWNIGEIPDTPVGKVIEIDPTGNGKQLYRWVNNGTYYKYEFDHPKGTYWWAYHQLTKKVEVVWDGKLIAILDDEKQTEIMVEGHRYVRGARRHYNHSIWWEVTRFEKVAYPPTFSGKVAPTGGSGRGLEVWLDQYANGAARWHIVTPGTGYANGERVTIPRVNAVVTIYTDERDYVTNSLNPHDAIADVKLYGSERNSNDDNPEHEIVYVNEQVEQPKPKYNSLAIAGLRLNSSKEWTSFSSFSAYFTKGVMVERLTTGGRSATNLLPEIAYALLTDSKIGAGEVIGADQVDRGRMVEAAKFCEANGFYWDGVLSERVNLRQWIYEQAGFCLLDFTILGGRFSLVPSVPYKSDWTINRSAKPDIKALFTDGNMRDLRTTFLSPEERQLFKAVCLYRQEELNGFAQTRVLSVRLIGREGGSDSDPEETFDMTAFCCSRQHAYRFARYALRTRQLVDHGVQFKTTPQAAMGLEPGQYFRLASTVTHTSRFKSGSVSADGAVVSVEEISGSVPVFYWTPGTEGVKEATLTVNNGVTKQSGLFGTLFAVKDTTSIKRVYKVETLSYDDDGLVDVAGSYVPLRDDGRLAVLDWDSEAFVVEQG